jgi:acetyltransferase
MPPSYLQQWKAPDGTPLAAWEFALIVGDAWQGQGVGRCLLTALIAEAGRRRLQRLIGHIAIDNRPMLKLARSCGFLVDRDGQDASTCIATLDVGARPEAKSPGLLGWLRA